MGGAGLGAAPGVGDGEGPGVGEGEAAAGLEGLGLGDGEGLGDGTGDGLGVADGAGVGEGDGTGEGDAGVAPAPGATRHTNDTSWLQGCICRLPSAAESGQYVMPPVLLLGSFSQHVSLRLVHSAWNAATESPACVLRAPRPLVAGCCRASRG